LIHPTVAIHRIGEVETYHCLPSCGSSDTRYADISVANEVRPFSGVTSGLRTIRDLSVTPTDKSPA